MSLPLALVLLLAVGAFVAGALLAVGAVLLFPLLFEAVRLVESTGMGERSRPELAGGGEQHDLAHAPRPQVAIH